MPYKNSYTKKVISDIEYENLTFYDKDLYSYVDSKDDGDFLVSAIVGGISGSAILGGLVGGSLTGGIAGDLLDGDLFD